jgi:arabinofuranosyltransferase
LRAGAGLKLLAMLAVLHGLSYFYVTSDDAFISLRYARNLATSHGLAYNPGYPPVEGFSNPLFTFLSALMLRLGVPALWAVKGMGMAALAAATVLAARLATVLCEGAPPRDRRAPRPAHRRDGRGAPDESRGHLGTVAELAGGALLAASPFAALWSVAGLETMLHAAVLLAACLCATVEVLRERVRWTPVWFVLVVASRPESGLLALTAAVVQWAALRLRPRVVVAWTTGFAVPAALLLAARWAYFGALAPNTFQAKVFFGREALAAGAEYLRGFLVDGGWWVVAPAAVAIVLLVVHGRRAEGSLSARSVIAPRARARSRWAVFVPVALVVAQAVFVILVGGDGMPGYRFVMPVYPMLCSLAAAALVLPASMIVGRSVPSAGRDRPRLAAWRRWSPALLGALLACGTMVGQARGLQRHDRRYWLVHDRPWPTYLLQTDLRGTWLQGHEEVGRYVREHAGPNDVLAVTEAGVIPYYAGLQTIDLLGLNDREISAMWARGVGAYREMLRAGAPVHRAPVRNWVYDVAAYVQSFRPRWLVVDGHVGTDGTFRPRLQIGWWLLHGLEGSNYRKVFSAPVYRGAALGFDTDRVDVVFERVGHERRRGRPR